MKTSTLLMIAGGAAALYYLSKQKAAEAAQGVTAQGVQSPPFAAPSAVAQMAPQVTVVVSDDMRDDDYGSWGWAAPVYGGRSWRGGGGHGGGHGHGHGGHH
ncbi:MAG TPA: hypothetical protein VK607_03500 [Kofleriaceae bacterium]|nr:hypothetical protein [Kofleriaceae bacterium]